MTLFLLVGGLGVLMLVGGLIFGELLDGVFHGPAEGLFGALAPDAGLSAAIGAGLGAFGFIGALLLGPFGLLLAVLGGGVAALALGIAAISLTRLLLGAPPPPVRSGDLLGVFGTVVTPIPAVGLGEVVLPQAGSRVKLAARSHEPVPTGTSVYVVEVLSATSVAVQRADLL